MTASQPKSSAMRESSAAALLGSGVFRFLGSISYRSLPVIPQLVRDTPLGNPLAGGRHHVHINKYNTAATANDARFSSEIYPFGCCQIIHGHTRSRATGGVGINIGPHCDNSCRVNK